MLRGLLRLHGRDIARLQRLLDPLLVSLLFIVFNDRALAFHTWGRLPLCLWLALIVALVLARPVSTPVTAAAACCHSLARFPSPGLVLTALLLISFATKTTATFSRLDTSLWALASWLLLLASHVGLRQLLRLHRSRGGNSRTILYWGSPQAAAAFAAEVEANRWMGLKLVAWFGPEPPGGEPPTPRGCRPLGGSPRHVPMAQNQCGGSGCVQPCHPRWPRDEAHDPAIW